MGGPRRLSPTLENKLADGTNRARSSVGSQRPDGRSVRISAAEKARSAAPSVVPESDGEISSSIGLQLLIFVSADWRPYVTSPLRVVSPHPPNNESATTTEIPGSHRQPFECWVLKNVRCRVRPLTPVCVGILGLVRDGEWLAAAHSHFASNRSNRPIFALRSDGVDVLDAPVRRMQID
ncbi:hypothetical protein N7526_002482 [Penicillium atrosanguineum]|nr:hypothetical protein N7526_002482 [Penicillium atrosanguineum]